MEALAIFFLFQFIIFQKIIICKMLRFSGSNKFQNFKVKGPFGD